MDKSESIKEIATALNKAQSQMGGAAKAANNPFFNAKYADLSEVVKVIKEPFAENGLSYMQFPIESGERIGVETIVMHNSGEWISQKYTVKCEKQNAQGAGSAITYCRRYALQSIAGIPSEDDDGNNAVSGKVPNDNPWYNESDLNKEIESITSAIRDGMPPEDVISQIVSNGYRVSNKIKDKIKSI